MGRVRPPYPYGALIGTKLAEVMTLLLKNTHVRVSVGLAASWRFAAVSFFLSRQGAVGFPADAGARGQLLENPQLRDPGE